MKDLSGGGEKFYNRILTNLIASQNNKNTQESHHTPQICNRHDKKMMFRSTAAMALALFAAVVVTSMPKLSVAVKHPLDSLATDEYSAIVQILTKEGRFLEDTRVPRIALLEPEKSFVKAWSAGEPFPRKVTAMLKEGAIIYKAIVDLVAETVESFVEIDGEDMFLLEEVLGATELAIADQAMIDGLALRGFGPTEVYCLPLSAGSFGLPIEEGTRLMKVPCYSLPSGSNWWAMPIEGLFALVDLSSKTVLEVVDTGVVSPAPKDPWGYTAKEIKERFGSLRGPTSGTSSSQTLADAVPPTRNYSVEDSIVKWDIFSFHYRVDKRPGLVLSDIKVNDKGTIREVLYQTHLSEVFVPYMDPDIGWFWRTYMDSGEYGFGVFMSPLSVGVDCPSDATYVGATFHDDVGQPFTIPDSICMFERTIGDPIWRHYEIFAQGPDQFTPTEGRASSEFVIRYAAEIGNYDYLVDFIFMQDGTIKMGVGSTGIDAVKGVATMSMKDATAAADTKYGSLIAPNLVAVHHSHFFNFRLDFDVDGDENVFEKVKLVPMNISDMNISRTSMWDIEVETIDNELDARTKINSATPSNYLFVNKNKESGLGHNPGYQLIPGGSFSHSLLSMDDWPVKRNPYIENQLWVTPYDADQLYAGGEYAVQSKGDDTLQTWTDQGRSITNTDIVAWYTVGFHHVPRMEDWPVMPTHWAYFYIRPFNFFTENPAIMLTEASGLPQVGSIPVPLTSTSETSSASVTGALPKTMPVIMMAIFSLIAGFTL
jgi:primary-amine oxidase